LAGKGYTVEEVMEVCLEDQVFYEESGGGVTLSGGEALAQGEFAETLLVRLGEAGIHRAIETSGYAAPETFARIAARTDLLFFDLKHPDPARHLAGTGVAQEPILENFRAALRASHPGSAVGTCTDGTCAVGRNAVGESARRLQVLPRIPVIPGYNDSLPDADAFTELLLSAGAREVQLLPFHQFGQNKYKLLGLDYGLAKEKALHPEDLEPYRARFEKQGIRAFF
jgi:pyruvate formate lyase activating enzyme